MVVKYPRSLQDVIEGDVVGPGYHSLLKQLQAQIENVKRCQMRMTQDEDDTDEIPDERYAAVQETWLHKVGHEIHAIE